MAQPNHPLTLSRGIATTPIAVTHHQIAQIHLGVAETDGLADAAVAERLVFACAG